MAPPEFTSHNIRLDDGTFTKPDYPVSMEFTPGLYLPAECWRPCFLETRTGIRLADLGCLEGGYAVEFARMGFQVLGMDVRESNITTCNYREVENRTG
jgi:2-polyprenyl-3-methyl-5-hydroxy-6-metoxy-1,4-benzoquinol methylase